MLKELLLPKISRCFILCIVILLAGWQPAIAGEIDSQACFHCHIKISEHKNFNSLEKANIVDYRTFEKSKHFSVGCTGCHTEIKELPHKKITVKVGCGACHSKIEEEYKNSVHGVSFEKGDSYAAQCTSCHGYHNILSVKDINSPEFPYNLPITCGKCHDNPTLAKKHNLGAKEPFKRYGETVHGKGLYEAGLLVTATCKDCHGVHNIKKKAAPDSQINFENLPETCGKCHARILKRYRTSVHGQLWKKNKSEAPTCATCHPPHQVISTEKKDFKLEIIKTCGSCHKEQMKTYRSSYHGKVTSLGYVDVATCIDCHHYHEVFSRSDPRSTISSSQILDTCRKCHSNATKNMTKYLAHADPHNRQKYPVLFYILTSMTLLLFSVFTFFGIHTILWMIRSLVDRRKHSISSGRAS